MHEEESADVIARPIGLMITALIVACAATVTAMRTPATLRQYRAMFTEFGADLETPTRIVLATPWAWWLFALGAIVLAVWVIARPHVTRAQYRNMKLAVRTFTVIFGLAIAFAVYALYSPIFKLGAAV